MKYLHLGLGEEETGEIGTINSPNRFSTGQAFALDPNVTGFREIRKDAKVVDVLC
jgi:hypothetical protein